MCELGHRAWCRHGVVMAVRTGSIGRGFGDWAAGDLVRDKLGSVGSTVSGTGVSGAGLRDEGA